MRKLLLVFFAVTGPCVTMAAQDRSHFEVFGGYSFERTAPCGVLDQMKLPATLKRVF